MSKFDILDSTTSAARATGSGGLNQGSPAAGAAPRDAVLAAGMFAGQGIASA